jgi:L-threonylcarbamoyladenylate synthase
MNDERVTVNGERVTVNGERVRRIDPLDPQPEIIGEAAAIIRRGGVVVFPTRSLYGLAADPFDPGAVSRIFTIKRRPPDKPILLLVRDRGDVARLVRSVPDAAERLMARFWPGRLTLVMEAGEGIASILTAGTGKIGLRLPQNRVAVSLIRAVGGPITGTSANLSGEAGCFRIADLAPEIAREADLILDAGALLGGAGSSVVDATVDPPGILREGAIPAGELLRNLR